MRKNKNIKTHRKNKRTKRGTKKGGGCGCGGSKDDGLFMKGGTHEMSGYINPASISYSDSSPNYYPYNTNVGGDPTSSLNMISTRQMPNMSSSVSTGFKGGSKNKTKRRKHTKGQRKMKGGYPAAQGTLDNPLFPSWLKTGGNMFSLSPPVSSPVLANGSPQVKTL